MPTENRKSNRSQRGRPPRASIPRCDHAAIDAAIVAGDATATDLWRKYGTPHGVPGRTFRHYVARRQRALGVAAGRRGRPARGRTRAAEYARELLAFMDKTQGREFVRKVVSNLNQSLGDGSRGRK